MKRDTSKRVPAIADRILAKLADINVGMGVRCYRVLVNGDVTLEKLCTVGELKALAEKARGKR